MTNLVGKVEGFHGDKMIVRCDDAPDHLKVHYLSTAPGVPWTTQAPMKIFVGSRVELEYSGSPTMGRWLIARVLS